MAVLNVKEDWQRRTAEESTDGASATRVYTVEFDEADNVAKRPLMALYATGIPRRYQVHPYNPWLYVRNKTANTLSLCVYEVTVNYDVRASSDHGNDSDPFLHPLDEEPEILWTFVTSTEMIDEDIYGKAILNKAGEPFDPPITKEFHDLVLRISRNEESYDPLKAAQYIGSLNNDLFWGFGWFTVLCTVFDGQKARKANLTYWKVTYEFQIRWDGWARRILNAGFRERVNGEPKHIEIDGSRVSQPWPLKEDGSKYTANEIFAGSAHWLEFDLHKALPFSLLGL